MAYDVNYFYERGQQSAEESLSSLIQGLHDAGVDASTAQMSRGTDWPQALDWVSGELTSGGRDTGINVEIHTDDMSVNLAWESVADSPGAPARPANLGTCTLTLVGEADSTGRRNTLSSEVFDDGDRGLGQEDQRCARGTAPAVACGSGAAAGDAFARAA